MAHFAELDSNNKVLRVIVVHNNELLINGVENESKGIDFCKSLYGENTKWIQTSYNNKFRKKFCTIGDTYDQQKDIFIPEKPYNSWIYNEISNAWDPPIPRPIENLQSNQYCEWDEINQIWTIKEI